MKYRKGQGATEYLVLLAVVLIIALVSIALLGFFPGLAADAKITQSNAYWSGQARPFAILEHSANVTGTTATLSLIIQNVEATGTFTIKNISVAAGGAGSGTLAAPLTVASGDRANATITVSSLPSPAKGSLYEYTVIINYTSPYGVANSQYGAKPLIGRYS